MRRQHVALIKKAAVVIALIALAVPVTAAADPLVTVTIPGQQVNLPSINVPGQSVTTPGAEVQSRTITTPAVGPVGGETPTYPDPIGYDDPNGDRLVTVEPGGTTLNLPEVYVPTQSVTTPGMRLNQRTIETPSVCIGGGSMRTKI